MVRGEVHRAALRRLAGVVVVGRVFVVGVAVGVAYLDDPAGRPATVMMVGQQHDHEQQHNGTSYPDYKASVLHAAKIAINRRIRHIIRVFSAPKYRPYKKNAPFEAFFCRFACTVQSPAILLRCTI